MHWEAMGRQREGIGINGCDGRQRKAMGSNLRQKWSNSGATGKYCAGASCELGSNIESHSGKWGGRCFFNGVQWGTEGGEHGQQHGIIL